MFAFLSRLMLATALMAVPGSAAAHVSVLRHEHPHTDPAWIWSVLPGLDVLLLGVVAFALGAGWVAYRQRLK